MFRRQRHHSIRSASVWAPSSPPPPHLAPTIRTNRTAAHVLLPPLPHPHPHCLPAADRGSSFAGLTSCMTASTGARWQRQLPREAVTTSPGRPQSTKTCSRHPYLLLSTRGQDPMSTISPAQGKNIYYLHQALFLCVFKKTQGQPKKTQGTFCAKNSTYWRLFQILQKKTPEISNPNYSFSWGVTSFRSFLLTNI